MISRHLAQRLAPLACALCLAACGQKGPLFLPDEGAAPVKVTPPAEGTAATPDRSDEARKHIH
jgi:predicted small lipoprotein YifL